MVAVVEFLVRQGRRWLEGCIHCCGKSFFTICHAALTSSVVGLDNIEFERRGGQVLNPDAHEQVDLDDEADSSSLSRSGAVDSGPFRKTSSSRKATGVTLQRCFNSLAFPDCLPGLVPLLFKDNQRVVQEHAARAIAELCTLHIRHWQIIVYPNCITGLERLLSRKYSFRVRQYAALALGSVGASQDMQTFVHGITERPNALYHLVKALVPLLFRDECPSLQDQAYRALTDLSSVRISLEEIGAATNAIPGFVRLLAKTENHYGQDCAALALSNLAISQDNTGRIVNCPGALRILIGLLVDSGHRYALQESVTMTLTNLVYSRENAIVVLQSPYFLKFLNGLTHILSRPYASNNSVVTREMAAKTLMNLFVTKEIIEKLHEFPDELLDGLVYSLMEDQGRSAEYAAMALGNLALLPENTQRIASTPYAVLRLLFLLPMFENPGRQREAVFAMLNLSHGDEKLKIQIADDPTALPSLVTLLFKNDRMYGDDAARYAQDSTLQECAVDVLCNLACVEQNSIKIAKFPGALERLVALFLDNSNPTLQGKVAVVVNNLAIESGNKVILAEFPNLMSGLVHFLFASDTPLLQEYAAQILSRLTIVEATQVNILTDFPELLEGLVLLLSNHDNTAAQESAAWALKYLSRAKDNRVKIAEFPAALEGLWNVILRDDRPVLQETAIICLSSLAIEDKTKIPLLEFPNMLRDLVHLLSEGDSPHVQGLSALVLGALAQNSWWIQLKVVSYPDADVIALLTQLLNNTDDKPPGYRVAVNASWAIACLATAPETQRQISKCPNTVETLVRLISDRSSSDELKHQIVTALGSLVEEDKNRVVIADAMEALASLLEANDNLINKESRSFKWCAAKTLTLIDVEKGRSLTLQCSFACGGRAEALLRLGMYKEALQDLDEANRLDPECGTTLSYRSFVKTMMEDCKGAVHDADRAVELEPEYLVRWSERGILRRIVGNLDGALEDLDKAIEMDFDKKDHYSNFKHRGYTKFLLGDEAGAQADAKFALRDGIPEWVSFDRLPAMLGCLPVEFLGYDLK